MQLDFSKLSPTSRMVILKAIDDAACRELKNIQDDLEQYWNTSAIKSDACKEMCCWRDALVDIRRSVIMIQKN